MSKSDKDLNALGYKSKVPEFPDKNILENCQHEGGISGKPLFNKSSELIRKIKQIDDEVFLIGVGGVFSKNDYQNKISDGASLIQVYTGFIYEGPSIVKNILS